MRIRKKLLIATMAALALVFTACQNQPGKSDKKAGTVKTETKQEKVKDKKEEKAPKKEKKEEKAPKKEKKEEKAPKKDNKEKKEEKGSKKDNKDSKAKVEKKNIKTKRP